MENNESTEVKEVQKEGYSDQIRRGLDSGKWSILLILVGLYFLLREFNILNDQIIQSVVKAWPLILVWLGIQSATKDNKKMRSIGMVVVIAILVFIILQNSGLRLPWMK
jgi:Domain of unknown function (DUF5668)